VYTAGNRPDDTTLFALDLGLDTVHMYHLDLDNGKLTLDDENPTASVDARRPRVIEGPDPQSAAMLKLAGCAVGAAAVAAAAAPAGGATSAHNDGYRTGAMGPRHMAFHPSLNVAFVANELDASVTVMEYTW
jgi:6-phosphogluconolactonase (cycloisomerase 2 family)